MNYYVILCLLYIIFLLETNVGLNNVSNITNNTECPIDPFQKNWVETNYDPMTSSKFIPFEIKHKMGFNKLIKEYSKWHKSLRLNKKLKCEDIEGIVFSARDGIGDTCGALTAAFILAIKTGRFFTIKWWVGLGAIEKLIAESDFIFDFNSINSNDRQLCLHDKFVEIVGHVTINDSILQEPHINPGILFVASYSDLLSYFFRPSVEVQQVIDETMNKFKDIHLISAVIRTGWKDWHMFLKRGDEKYFESCIYNYVKHKHNTEKTVALFIASDDEGIKSQIKENLESRLNCRVVSIEDSYIHVTKPLIPDTDAQLKLVKTFAEFHLISKSNTVFLTQSSLFGRAAAEMGRVPEKNIFYISASDCDDPNRFGYSTCHSPKIPSFC